jgi:hypothetical protein
MASVKQFLVDVMLFAVGGGGGSYHLVSSNSKIKNILNGGKGTITFLF